MIRAGNPFTLWRRPGRTEPVPVEDLAVQDLAVDDLVASQQ